MNNNREWEETDGQTEWMKTVWSRKEINKANLFSFKNYKTLTTINTAHCFSFKNYKMLTTILQWLAYFLPYARCLPPTPQKKHKTKTNWSNKYYNNLQSDYPDVGSGLNPAILRLLKNKTAPWVCLAHIWWTLNKMQSWYHNLLSTPPPPPPPQDTHTHTSPGACIKPCLQENKAHFGLEV